MRVSKCAFKAAVPTEEAEISRGSTVMYLVVNN